MADDLDQAIFYELYACAPEVHAKINIGSGLRLAKLQPYQSVRLPRQISDPLLYEMEYCIVEAVLNEKIEKLLLSDVLFKSAHLSNIIYSSHMTSCLRAVQEGDAKDFNLKLKASKQELLFSSEESTEYIYTAVVKLQIFHHLGMAWGLR
ncbi:hypothetical protein POM88_035812 [Heracleum sosnowskyi]|uniref:Uncharacterized protein n=1 Tax=Heracleum sosnowskyi TaxID=360622 RepID=A0AAD8MBV1_9APIA|nr:hypothetical protein POM88_035812 [Heracleum sosnowskyi]